MAQDFSDKLIFTTPRALAVTIGGIITGGLAVYGVIATTFVAKTDYDAYQILSSTERHQTAQRLANHEASTEIYRLTLSRESVEDQMWLVEQRMKDPAGNTIDNRERKQDLLKRKAKINDQINCLQRGHSFCRPSIGDL